VTAIGADRLGTGWPFPPEPGPARTLDWLSGPALVRQSILLILDTEPGERVMRPEFGCGLSRYLMEPNTPATRAAIAREIETALAVWEPRIDVGAVEVVPAEDPGAVLVSVSYTLVRDQSVDGVRVVLAVAPTGGGR
jgi:phage baseplate assembly protein W